MRLDIAAALAARFPKPEYLLWFEVRDGGFHGRRTADALALNVWEGRGQQLHGFEIKTSRQDWLRELKQPAKAESIQRYCDRWWLVTCGDGIVKDGELPAPWGHIAVASDVTSEVLTKAPKLEPHPWPRTFTVQLLRAIDATYGQHIRREQIAAELGAARRQGETSARHAENGELMRLRDEVENTRRVLAAIGIRADELRFQVSPERVGTIVRTIMRGNLDRLGAGSLHHARNHASAFVRDVDTLLAALEEAKTDA